MYVCMYVFMFVGMYTMGQKHLSELSKKIEFPVLESLLPYMSFDEFNIKCKQENRKLTIINNIIHDISSFMNEHPGGQNYIKMCIGRDVTAMFNGKTNIYKHSVAANNLLAKYRIAKLIIVSASSSSLLSNNDNTDNINDNTKILFDNDDMKVQQSPDVKSIQRTIIPIQQQQQQQQQQQDSNDVNDDDQLLFQQNPLHTLF